MQDLPRGETLPLFQQQQQNWGSGLPRGVLAAAPGRRADVLLCLQGGAWAVDTGTLSPYGTAHVKNGWVPSLELLLGGGCERGNGRVHADPASSG